jgi:hypothetical protein
MSGATRRPCAVSAVKTDAPRPNEVSLATTGLWCSQIAAVRAKTWWAQIIDGHKLQWPTTQDSGVVDEPGQRSVTDSGARRRQLLGIGDVKTDRCQTAGAQPLGVLIATYTGQHREAALAQMQCNRFANAAGRAGDND